MASTSALASTSSMCFTSPPMSMASGLVVGVASKYQSRSAIFSNVSAISADSRPLAITWCHMYCTLTLSSRPIAFCTMVLSPCLPMIIPLVRGSSTRPALCAAGMNAFAGDELVFGHFRLVRVHEDELAKVLVAVQVDLRKADRERPGPGPRHCPFRLDDDAVRFRRFEDDLGFAGSALGRHRVLGFYAKPAHADVDPADRPHDLPARPDQGLGPEGDADKTPSLGWFPG